MSKALHIPLDTRLTSLFDIPYTISYVIRKRQQIDNFSELPKSKRPPEEMIWEGYPEDIDDWIERVFKLNEKQNTIDIPFSEIEG